MIVAVRDRTQQDRAEIARRVKTYRRQVETYGRIYWLRNVMKLRVRKVKEDRYEESSQGDD